MTVSWRKAVCAHFERDRGVSSMMGAVLIAGIGVLLAGLLAIGYGIPIKEFGFGNTMIIAGAVAACTGAMMLTLWMVVRELKTVAQRLGSGAPGELHAGNRQAETLSATLGNQAPEDGGFLFGRDQAAAENAGQGGPAAQSPPWHEEAASRDRVRIDAPAPVEPAEAAPVVKPRRNLLFSSSSRKERERAEARSADPAAAEPDLRPAPAVAPPVSEPNEPPPASFDDAWPKSERARTADPLPRRSVRAPSTFTESNSGVAGVDRQPPAARSEEPPPVTVLKSGVVDGMAYSLYSDGSIEAQMPEGMMRFASIDELRSHLDQRP
jgi:hypothetical protein